MQYIRDRLYSTMTSSTININTITTLITTTNTITTNTNQFLCYTPLPPPHHHNLYHHHHHQYQPASQHIPQHTPNQHPIATTHYYPHHSLPPNTTIAHLVLNPPYHNHHYYHHLYTPSLPLLAPSSHQPTLPLITLTNSSRQPVT